MEKQCNKCEATLPLEDFHLKKRGRYGRQAQCKTCRNAHESERYTEYNARPEVKAQQAEYYRANPEVWWESNFRRRSTAYGFIPRVVSFTQGQLYERWGSSCVHCGSEDGTTLDHWPQPVSRGGEHSLDNCRPSCMSCQYQSWKPDFTPTAHTNQGETEA